MNIFVSIAIGLVLHYLFIRPLEVERYRKECIKDGLVPKGNLTNVNNVNK